MFQGLFTLVNYHMRPLIAALHELSDFANVTDDIIRGHKDNSRIQGKLLMIKELTWTKTTEIAWRMKNDLHCAKSLPRNP